MVDAIVSFVVKKLGEVLIEETLLLLGVGGEVEELRDELRRMQCFLKDADAKQLGDERVRNWVAEIRNIAYDAEDVVDNFILKIDAPTKSCGILNLITRKASVINNSKHLHKLGNDIQAIQGRLKAISDSRVTYGIDNLRDNEASNSAASQMIQQQQLRNHYPHVEDDHDIIGLEEHTKTLLTELLKDDERRSVVSIVGVGGLGKTTLAKKMYKHDIVTSRFDCHAWSSISQQFNPVDSLLELIKTSMNLSDSGLNTIRELNVGDLIEKLHHYLRDKRYFIVVDDLWSIENWSMLSLAFPNGKRGSKVLLTTRNKEVASLADPWSLQLEPDLLNDENSWELLCKNAFPRCMGDARFYPTGMEKLGREMVRKCGGLPLAICVLGGILATKREEIKEWEYVNRDITSNINKRKYGGVMRILELSYNDLPVHLKPCFLYLGLFPEGNAIPRKKLIQLWVAEGFITDSNSHALGTTEYIGKHEYLAELIQRCMIQVGKEVTPGKGKTCRMHDLMRDLCLSKAKETDFLDVYYRRTDDTTPDPSSSDTCRRLRRYAIHLNDQTRRFDFYFNNSASSLRTLVIENPLDNPIAPLKYQNLILLRVLDLENAKRFNKPMTKEVFKLLHLRYLAFRVQENIKISSSISNLRNLQTLKLIFFRGVLPENIMKLVKLRHLIKPYTGEVTDNFRIENLINLQTLEVIKAGKWIRNGCLEKLTKLLKLSVVDATRLETDILIDEIANRTSSSSPSTSSTNPTKNYQSPIRVLSIRSNEIFSSKIFDSLSRCNNLRQLQLGGKLDDLNLETYPPNLRKLELYYTELENDPMEVLQHLPLTFLAMDKTYIGEEMVCSMEGFPHLQHLHICALVNLRNWTIDLGAMPRLKELHLSGLTRLPMLPDGLRFITTLKELKIVGMPWIKDRVVRETGEDWYKIQHIPSVIVTDW